MILLLLLLLVLKQLLSLLLLTSQQVSSEDFCQGETFNVSCKHDEFVLITSALYGRMNVGRCTPVDFYTSCSLDVLPQMESRCSGRRKCVVNVADRDLFRVQPCRKDLHAYLEASYKCVKIAGSDNIILPSLDADSASFGLIQCQGPSQIDQSNGYLSRSFSLESGLGSESCPWYLEVKNGQRIRFTLINFQASHQTNSDQQEMSKSFFDGEKCASVVFVEVSGVANQPNPLKQQQQQQQRIKDFLSRELPEKSTQKMPEVHSMKHREEKVKHTFEKWRNRTYSDSKVHFVGICPGRQRSTMVSIGNKVFAYWVTNRSVVDRQTDPERVETPIFLKFEAIGCPDVTSPPNTWSVRNGDTMFVNCNYTQEKWKFTCDGGSWVGRQVNCSISKNEDKALQNADFREVRNIPLGLMLAISVGVVIGIAIGFFFLLLVCICRRKIGKRRYNNVKVADHEENIYKLIDFHSLPPPSSTHSLPTQVRASTLNLSDSSTPPPFADVIPHNLPDLQLMSGSCVTSSSSHVTSSWIDSDSIAENAGSRGGCVSLGRSSGSGVKRQGEGSTWTLARPGSKLSLYTSQKNQRSSNNNVETCIHYPHRHHHHHHHRQFQQEQHLKSKTPYQVVCGYQRRGSQQTTCKRCLECADIHSKQMDISN